MGRFTDGYNYCLGMQTGKHDASEYEEELKNLIKTSTYNECKEWYHGFHAAMLQLDLTNLKEAFSALKNEAEKARK